MKEIIKQVIHGKPHLHIGKAGITDEILIQVEKLFNKRMVIKIRILNLMNFDTVKEAMIYFSKVTNTEILDIRGKTGVIAKKKIGIIGK